MEDVADLTVDRPLDGSRGFQSHFYPHFNRVEPQTHQRLRELLVPPSVDLDLDALNVFLRIGTFVGTDTAFRHIKADPPDYEWAASIKPCDLDHKQIIDTYIDLFQTSVGRCEDAGEVALPLSGGQDSRHILLELCRQKRKPSFCWTVDIPWRPSEANIAALLCKRLKVPHSRFRLHTDLIAVESQKLNATDFSPFQHTWMADAIYNGMANGYVLYDGIGGDVLSAGLFLSEKRVRLLQEDRIDELVEDFVGPDEKIYGVDDPTLFPRFVAIEKVNDEFRRHLRAPDPISSFYFWNRTRRDIGCSTFALLREKAKQVQTPFLDPELATFLASLRPGITVGRSVHAEVIAAAYPEFNDIPYASAGLKEVAHGRTYLRKAAVATLRYVIARSCPILNRGAVYARILRSMISPKHAADGILLAPRIVYLTELFRSVGQ